MKYLICFLLLFSYSCFADSENLLLKKSVQDSLDTFNKIDRPLFSADCMLGSKEVKKIKCLELASNFCKKLEGQGDDEGNLKTFDGKIMTGKSPKSGMALSVIENDKSLINSLPNLPNEIQKELRPIIEKLNDHYTKEDDTSEWSKKYSEIKTEISDALEKLADQQFDKENAPYKANETKNWKIGQSMAYKKIARDIFDQITIVKYAHHPNWKRVEDLYPKVVDNLSKTIDLMNIPQETKEKVKTKLMSVKLSLPMRDPGITNASKECAETEVNAFYTSYTNTFTVCAGNFNQFQSASSLARTIGHELAHAFDSDNFVQDEFDKNDFAQNSLSKLINQNKQTYKCDEWKKIVDKILIPPTNFTILGSPFDKLYSCLRRNSNLEEMSTANVKFASKQLIKVFIAKEADKETFTDLLKKSEEVYYRPDLMTALRNGYIEQSQKRDVSTSEIFMQDFYCALEENKINSEQFESLDKAARSRIFEKSIGQTSKVMEAWFVRYFQYCGKNCGDLTSFNLAFNPAEKVADWFSAHAYPEYLKTLNPEDRAEAAALGVSRFCPYKNGSDLLGAQLNFSLEIHPDNLLRVSSFFTPEVAKLVGCEIDEKEMGDSQCMP